MSYEKQTWKTGDTITAAKLNHIEDGISTYMIRITDQLDSSGFTISSIIDKTWNELRNAFLNFPVIYVHHGEITIEYEEQEGFVSKSEYNVLTTLFFTHNIDSGTYTVEFNGDGMEYICTDPDDYPSWTDE